MTNHREKQEKAVLQHQALEHLGKVWHRFHPKLSQTGLLRVHNANDLIVIRCAAFSAKISRQIKSNPVGWVILRSSCWWSCYSLYKSATVIFYQILPIYIIILNLLLKRRRIPTPTLSFIVMQFVQNCLLHFLTNEVTIIHNPFWYWTFLDFGSPCLIL